MINNKNKTEQYQLITLVSLMVIILFAITTLGTLALYSRISRDSGIVTLAPAVEVGIVSNLSHDFGKNVAYPGSKYKVKLGLKLQGSEGQASSNAYVRVKLSATSEIDSDKELIDFSNLIPVNTEGGRFSWVKTNFQKTVDGKLVDDIWYVYVMNTIDFETNELLITEGVIVTNGQEVDFVDGTIKISEDLTKEFANKKITLTYLVEASQSANVANPLKFKTENDSYENRSYTDPVTNEIIYLGQWQVADR